VPAVSLLFLSLFEFFSHQVLVIQQAGVNALLISQQLIIEIDVNSLKRHA